WIHAHRVASGDCHYRDFDRAAPAGGSGSARGGAAVPVQKQPQADRVVVPTPPRRLQILSDGWLGLLGATDVRLGCARRGRQPASRLGISDSAIYRSQNRVAWWLRDDGFGPHPVRDRADESGFLLSVATISANSGLLRSALSRRPVR